MPNYSQELDLARAVPRLRFHWVVRLPHFLESVAG